MSQENKKYLRIETIQNWVAFGLMVMGIALAIGGYEISLYLLGAGVLGGLFLVVKRTLPKRLTVLTMVSILCCIYIPASYGLLTLFPHLYGYDLGALVNWSVSLIGAVLIAIALTSIELFRLSKK